MPDPVTEQQLSADAPGDRRTEGLCAAFLRNRSDIESDLVATALRDYADMIERGEYLEFV